MKKKTVLACMGLCVVMLLSACGKENTESDSALFKPVESQTAEADNQQVSGDENTDNIQTEEATNQQAADNSQEVDDKNTDNQSNTLTTDQIFKAVQKYYGQSNPDAVNGGNDLGVTEYWDVSTNETGEVVVLYRSYTGALIRFHVDPATGDAYVTEQVPGIIDEEQKNGETFNVNDYLD